jgi:hypothetical protein
VIDPRANVVARGLALIGMTMAKAK